MVLLIVVLLVPIGCGPATAQEVPGEGGLSDSATQNVQVEPGSENRPPKAVISGPTSGLVGETLSFSGANSTDESTTSSKTYTVQSGDTLMEISRKLFNGDAQYWDEIAELNDIKAPYTIQPGQELIVPEK